MSEPSLHLIGCTVDLHTREIRTHSGERKTLSPMEANLLRFLSEKPGTTLSRAVILREVWEYRTLETRTLDTAVMRIRRKIERDHRAPDHLQTVHGVGYRWHTPEVQAASPSSAIPSASQVPLVGRANELRTLHELVVGGRVTTLRGPGGVGKTTLARAVVARLRDRGCDVIWVEAGDSSTPASTIGSLAKELLVANSDSERLEALVGRVLAARPPVVIVLDNLERVVGELAPTLTSWLDDAPETAFLVTSRVPAGIDAEIVIEVPGLPPEEGARLLELRARAAGATGPLEESDLQAVARALDGIPLLLQLVARQVPSLPLTDIVRRLEQGTSELKSRRATGRHDSAEACVAWSWESLGDDERKVLQRVAWFVDGFDLPTMEQVLGPGTADIVLRLWEQSLLTKNEGGRYRLFRYVRDYVTTLPAPPDLVPSLVEGFVAECERLMASHDVRLEAEIDNILQVRRWAGEAGRTDLTVRSSLVAGELVWYVHGLAVAETIARETARATTTGPVERRVRALDQLSRALGRGQEARIVAEEALALAEPLGDPSVIAQIMNRLAGTQDRRTHAGLARSRALLESAATMLARLGDDAQTAVADLNLALVLSTAGEVEASRSAFLRALERAERVEGPRPRSGVLYCFASANLEWGELDEARSRARRAVSLLEGSGRRLQLLRARSVFARTLAADAETPYDRASQQVAVATQALREMGAREHVARALVTTALLDLSRLDLTPAVERLIEAGEVLGSWTPIDQWDIELYRSLADIVGGHPDRAIRRVVPLTDAVAPDVVVSARALAALAHVAVGNVAEAKRSLEGVETPLKGAIARDLLAMAQHRTGGPPFDPRASQWRLIRGIAGAFEP